MGGAVKRVFFLCTVFSFCSTAVAADGKNAVVSAQKVDVLFAKSAVQSCRMYTKGKGVTKKTLAAFGKTIDQRDFKDLLKESQVESLSTCADFVRVFVLDSELSFSKELGLDFPVSKTEVQKVLIDKNSERLKNKMEYFATAKDFAAVVKQAELDENGLVELYLFAMGELKKEIYPLMLKAL